MEIITHPHPTLKHQSKPILRINAELKAIVAEMFELMYEAKGVGLAANQVNLPLRVFVANPSGSRGEGEEFVFINPVISKGTGNEVADEGCLSLPGVYGPVNRSKSIHVEAFSIDGEAISLDLEDFMARVVQHETDHLDLRLLRRWSILPGQASRMGIQQALPWERFCLTLLYPITWEDLSTFTTIVTEGRWS